MAFAINIADGWDLVMKHVVRYRLRKAMLFFYSKTVQPSPHN